MDKKVIRAIKAIWAIRATRTPEHVKTQHCIYALDYMKLVFDLENMIYNFIYCLLFLKKVKKNLVKLQFSTYIIQYLKSLIFKYPCL